MDDFMIDDCSIHSAQKSASESSESCEDESQIFEKMEKFYDKNYYNFQICEIDNYHEEKVWNMEYD